MAPFSSQTMTRQTVGTSASLVAMPALAGSTDRVVFVCNSGSALVVLEYGGSDVEAAIPASGSNVPNSRVLLPGGWDSITIPGGSTPPTHLSLISLSGSNDVWLHFGYGE